MTREERIWLGLAFAAIYLIWGSTYLAIRYAIETAPPFLMAGVRFGLAGLLLSAWSRLRGMAWPTRMQWRTAAIVGNLLLLGGNGGVVWAEQRVPSSIAALVVSVVPLSAVLLEWIRPGGTRPTRLTIFGIILGFAGVSILINPSAKDAQRIDFLGMLSLLGATLSWAAGTIYTRHSRGADTPLMAASANMLMGGLGLLVAGILSGELKDASLQLANVSARSIWAVIYLIFFGSIVGFTAYTYILRHTSTALATTYAYVNPIVAIILGWAIAHEPLTGRVVLATAVIISGLIMITVGPQLRAWVETRCLGKNV